MQECPSLHRVASVIFDGPIDLLIVGGLPLDLLCLFSLSFDDDVLTKVKRELVLKKARVVFRSELCDCHYVPFLIWAQGLSERSSAEVLK